MVAGREGMGVVPVKRCNFRVAGVLCLGKGAGELCGVVPVVSANSS